MTEKLPRPQPPPESDKFGVVISVVFHTVIVVALVALAAHEGLLGTQLKKIAVELVQEKEKPKEPEKPKEEPPPVVAPKIAEVPKPAEMKEPPRANAAPPPIAAPTVTAPPPAELPSFDFGGGKSVQTTADPVELYRGYVEASLRQKWSRPAGIEDDAFVAEVQVTVQADGSISDPAWKKGSGNSLWDASVREAIRAARALDRPPPANFPRRVTIRFDVSETTEPVITP